MGYEPSDPDEVLEITDSAPRQRLIAAPIARGKPYKLSELYQFPELLAAPPAIIPGIAYAGRVTLISGREKSGKSTLIGQASAALSRGGSFLGDELLPLPPLWYAIDEPLPDTVQRERQFDADPETTFIFDERPSADDMRAEIESTGARVVVVDTLTELWRGKIRSENDASEIGPFLRPFVDVARDTGVALILLYHATKSGDGYRGSADIGATVDIILTLRQPGTSPRPDAAWDDVKEDDGRRILEGRGRGCVRVNHRLAFDGTGYSLGDSPAPLRNRIINELAREPASGSALADLLGARKDTVLRETRDLREEGLIESQGKAYRISPKGLASVSDHQAKPMTGTDSTETHNTQLYTREPERNWSGTDAGTVESVIGSQQSDIGTNAGTDKMRTVTNAEGQHVLQVLRPTAHGDRWLEQGAA